MRLCHANRVLKHLFITKDLRRFIAMRMDFLYYCVIRSIVLMPGRVQVPGDLMSRLPHSSKLQFESNIRILGQNVLTKFRKR